MNILLEKYIILIDVYMVLIFKLYISIVKLTRKNFGVWVSYKYESVTITRYQIIQY